MTSAKRSLIYSLIISLLHISDSPSKQLKVKTLEYTRTCNVVHSTLFKS